jgi:sugar phosphate isomerase/epimerase
MKLGLSPSGTWDVSTFDVDTLTWFRDQQFSGVVPRFPGFENLTQEECARIQSVYAQAGMDPIELGQYQLSFIDPDPIVRRAHMETMKRALERSAWMGCPVVITGSGSLNPASQWFDHRDNHSWRSFDLLAGCLRELVRTAQDTGVCIGLECHTYTALDSPERVRDLLDAVDSPMLRVDLDPVNWITYATYWDSGPFLHHMFDLLGDDLLGGHAKDVRQEDGLVVHLNETYAGDGNLDYGVYLQRMARLAPDTYLVMEHTAPEHVAAARDYILAEAVRVGVTFVS